MFEGRAFQFESHHFLFTVFNQKLQQYIDGGLVGFNVANLKEVTNPKLYTMYTNNEPFAILTLEELEAGFVVSLAPLILSILVFGIEWISTLKDLIVFLIIFKKYFDVKKSSN